MRINIRISILALKYILIHHTFMYTYLYVYSYVYLKEQVIIPKDNTEYKKHSINPSTNIKRDDIPRTSSRLIFSQEIKSILTSDDLIVSQKSPMKSI